MLLFSRGARRETNGRATDCFVALLRYASEHRGEEVVVRGGSADRPVGNAQ